MKLSLTSKAIILISTPLIFEVGSAFLLLDLQKQAEEEAERANHSRAVYDKINSISKEIYEVWNTASSVSRSSMLTTSFLNQSYKKTFGHLRKQYQELVNLAGTKSKLAGAVGEAIKALDDAEKILDSTCEELRSGNYDEVFANHKVKEKNLKDLYLKMLSQEFFLAEQEEEKLLKDSPMRLRQYRQRTINIFLIALAGNVVFSLILAVFLVGRVTNRLGHLSYEVRKLGTGRPISAPLAGSDEIAGLSKVLSTMAVELDTLLRQQGAIVANARDTICAIDDKGCFTAMNPAGERLFGYYADEVRASRFVEYVYAADKEKALNWYQTLRSGASGEEVELRIEREDGAVVTALWSGQWSEADRSLFCVIHDISERKELEQAKQELTAMLTHDLRTPLTTIQACLEMLEAGRLGSLNARGVELVQVADRNGARMMNLINDLLDIEKIKSGTMSLELAPVRIADMFQEVDLNLSQWMKESRIALKLQQTDLCVLADRDKICRVLFNLVSNAIKFSPPGSRISLSTLREGHWVKISVTDQGPGIPADQLDLIFERFAQVSSAEHKGKGGSGLGLAICRAIVNLHGGKIWATSSLGLGTTFYFTLPVA